MLYSIVAFLIVGVCVVQSSIIYFLGAQKSLLMVTAAMKLKDTPWKESYDQPRQHIKK